MASLLPLYVSNLGVGISNNVAGPLQVFGQGAASTTTGLVVASNAFVGVGKSNPGFALDVLGDLNFSGTFRSNGVPYIGSQWTTVATSNLYYSNVNKGFVGIGKSNPAFTLDVLGDLNFTGTFRSNGAPYIGSQWTTANTSNLYYSNVGGGLVGIGKSNPAFALDILGDINFSGSLRSNGTSFSVGSLVGLSTAPTYVELLTNNNTLAMTSIVHTYTSSSFMSPSVASTAIVSYSGSGWVAGGGLYIVTVTLNGTSRSVEVFNPGTTHMPTPNCTFAVQLAATTSYTITLTFSNNALTDTNDFHNLNVTMFPNAVQGSLNITSCYALWYSTSNVPAGNYVGTAAYGGTTAQNAAGNGTNPFSTATGLFTCQYTGVYQCNFTTNTYLPQDTVQIWRNGALIAPGYQAYGNVNNSISVSASIFCNAGDTLGFYVSSGTIQGASSGTQGCSVALVGSAGNITTPFTTTSLSNISLPAGSNLGIGKVPSYALDVAGDLNFTGTFRNNGAPYIGSQWTTTASNIGYASNDYIGGSLTIAGSNILNNVTINNTLVESSNIVINNAGTGPALSVTQSQTTSQPVATFVAGTTQALYINNLGNVGIGKTNPAFSLDVAGTIGFANMSSISFAGIVAYFAGTAAPVGWLIANGATISRTTYANLFANIGTTYGAGDGSTTFRIPDLRGYFIRSLDMGAGVDSGRTLSASAQADAYLNHSHTASSSVSDPGHGHSINDPGHAHSTPNLYFCYTGGGPWGGSSGHGWYQNNVTNAATTGITINGNTTGISVSTSVNTSTTGGSETRPKNMALLACIKY